MEAKKTIAMQVYPNPASQVLTIMYILEDGEKANLEVYNTSNQLVRTSIVESAGETTIDTQTLPAGMYCICIKNERSYLTKNFLVLKQ